jgi:hypothetical protein
MLLYTLCSLFSNLIWLPIPPQLFLLSSQIPKETVVYKLTVHCRLEHNPLECDCSLDWLLDYETLATLARCHAPNHLAGKRIVELKKKDFKCAGAGELGGGG